MPAPRADRCAVVFSEVRDRLEVRRKPSSQPHQLDIALGFPLKPPARSDLVDVAVNVDLQHRGGMVGRTARRLRDNARKPQGPQIQLVNERLDDSDLVLLSYKVVETLRKQNALPPILTLDKALHQKPRLMRQDSNSTDVFTQPAPNCDVHSRGRRWQLYVDSSRPVSVEGCLPIA